MCKVATNSSRTKAEYIYSRNDFGEQRPRSTVWKSVEKDVIILIDCLIYKFISP